MKRVVGVSSAVALAAVLAFAQQFASAASEEKKGLEIGDKAPAWEELKGLDDKPYSLKDLKKAKAVVVVFTCDRCPVAKAYEERFNEFAASHDPKEVALVAINVSPGEADDPALLREKAEESGLKFTYLVDPSQDIGRAYGATVTPHVFVLDADRKIAYMGAFDDNQNAKKVEHHYVKDAVDAILAGEKPEVDVTEQFGCGINYD
jgi:peroxiredoxin